MSELASRILELDDMARVAIEVPEWDAALDGAQLYVRELSGEERGELEQEWTDGEGSMRNLRVNLVAACLITEDWEQVFDTTNMALLARKSASVLTRISDTVLELSGITEAALEDAVGNSESGPGEDML